jgi:hypothetical protein
MVNTSLIPLVIPPFLKSGNEASIRVTKIFKSHIEQQYDKQVSCSII